MPATQPAAASAVALAAATDEAASGAHRALQEEAAPGAADALLQALQEHQAEALVPTPGIAAAASAARPQQGAGWLAWAIVALAFFSDGLCLGSRSFFAVVLEMWEAEFGWSRSYVSGAMSVVHVFNGLATPFAGHVIDVLGPRGGLTFGLAYLAGMLALTATVHHTWQLWVLFGVGLGTGFGLLNLNVYSAMIVQIVPPSRSGTAVGIATSGSTFGQFALVPLFRHIADVHGWRTGYLLAAATTALLIPLAWLLLTLSKSRIETSPNDTSTATAATATASPGVEVDSLRRKLTRLATSKLYWALTFAFVVCGITTTGFIESHIVAFATLKGMSAAEGAFAFGLLSAFNGAVRGHHLASCCWR